MEELLKRQEELQKEARGVLDKLNLLDILSSYGKPVIVGSLAAGLMTWKDIDLEITGEINEDRYWEVVKKIFHTDDYKRTFVIDFRKSTNPNTPKGLHICITEYDFKRDNDPWKIDIWFVNRTEPSFTDWLKEKVNDENRPDLLALKQEVRKLPGYGKEFYSVDVYKAVIEHGAKTLADFKTYLSQKRAFR